ncbi:MAG TPA: hypothetical protein ENG14_02125, partial [Thermodesulforhabdus norvegica]|nr:hypothetical protein [Thermodesulforhabdus norvegica]
MRKVSYSSYQTTLKGGHTRSRIIILMIFVFAAFSVIFVRLFQLQIMRHDLYISIAEDQHFGAIDLPARRGDIYVKDTHSGELSKLATNTTLDLLYVDPMVAENKQEIATKLTPIVFPQSEYEQCMEKPEECFYAVEKKNTIETLIVSDTVWDVDSGATKKVESAREEELDFKSYSAMSQEISEDILRKITKSEVDFVVLRRDSEDDLMADIINERLPGIFVDTDRFMIYGDPTLIPESQLHIISKTLATYLDEPPSTIETRLTRRQVRYVFLRNKLSPEASQAIEDLNLKGIVLLPEHWRFYPEGELGSHLVGFINRENTGQYGTEGYFNI